MSFRQFCAVLSRRSSERDRPSTSSGTSAAEAAAAVAATSAAIVVSQASDRHTTTSAGGSASASGAQAGGSGVASAESASNREVFRWRDRQYYGGPKRWLESALRDSTWQDKEDSNDGSKKSASHASGANSDANQSPLWLGDDLEFWPEKSNNKERLKFVKIASLNTELIAVSEKGFLYQWRWADMTPCRHDNPNGNHPRSAGLGLTNEKVVKISASNVRYVLT